ncbi:calcium/sodium antiporter [Salinarimonas rosea]|uniref:calcium/sodium antiporter n=1 Tax=Salinarimonas rosea TaxID=552063 RepID=UPI0004244565|nr:calcium/sodium antiporter [Salinarimonas rosea]
MNELGDYQLTVLSFGAIAFGLYLLIKGGDWTIDAAAFIAERAGLSKLFIGATIVAFGTSAPELFTSVNANLTGFPGISLGNIVGSNIANILLILGATAIVFTIRGKPSELTRDVVIMVGATVALVALMIYGVVPRWAGFAMFAVLAAFVAWQYWTDAGAGEADEHDEDADEKGIDTMGKGLGFFVAGLTALVVGSEMLVQGAVAAGTAIGVPEAVIGLTVVAVGTSLPELSTCIAAALKRQTNMIIGNIVGSNAFNILSIIGITAMLKPLTVDPALADLDMWVMAGVTLAFAAWMLTVSRIGRTAGVLMILAYVGFIGFTYQDLIVG